MEQDNTLRSHRPRLRGRIGRRTQDPDGRAVPRAERTVCGIESLFLEDRLEAQTGPDIVDRNERHRVKTDARSVLANRITVDVGFQFRRSLWVRQPQCAAWSNRFARTIEFSFKFV